MHIEQATNSKQASAPIQPVIPASENLPEITFKAVVLAIFLVIILAAANAYLGLKVGTTVSASIPAAVISMGVLSLFRRSNILENNIVQTAASAGEALVAGVAYILPALLIIHFWHQFNYWETVLIAMVGGIFGVLFSVPIRRVLLPHKALRFPEGTAIGQVLKASLESKAGLVYLVKGGAVGGIISICQTGFEIFSGSISFWSKFNSSFIYGFGFGLDPALLAAGYIVGINIALSILLGVVIGWAVAIPVLTHIHGIPAGDAQSGAMTIWHSYIRYIGVGTMLVGGFWTLITLAKPIFDGLRSSFKSIKIMGGERLPPVPRTELDLPIQYVCLGIALLLIPLSMLLFHFVKVPELQLGMGLQLSTIVVGIIFIVFVGFVFSTLGGYFAGLVGSTNSPGSALTLSTLLLVCLVLITLYAPYIHFATSPIQTLGTAALAIIITSVVSAGIVVTNETIQDLKAGQIVGATPWKQQVMLIIGVIVAAFVIPLILELLFNAYGIGGVFPHPGMDPAQMLAAPQAGLMAAIAQGVFQHNLPWTMIAIGAVIAVFCITIDHYLHNRGTALPVLAVGLGIYLPIEASMPFVLGGIVSYLVERSIRKQYPKVNNVENSTGMQRRQRGLILACGIVAGAALMGVILAIPFALKQSSDALKLVPDSFTPIANGLGVIVTLGLLMWIYQVVTTKKISK